MYGTTEWSREDADAIWYAGMLAANVPKLRAAGAYKAVRLAGGKSYRTGINEYVNIGELEDEHRRIYGED
jgi:hypothetical protein